MSPLAEAIYRILADRANLRQPPMTYSELVKTLRPVDVSHGDLTRDDPRLFEALGEVAQPVTIVAYRHSPLSLSEVPTEPPVPAITICSTRRPVTIRPGGARPGSANLRG